MKKIRVAINGYGVIGKLLADAVNLQTDMEVTGVCDITDNLAIEMVERNNYPVYAFDAKIKNDMIDAGIEVKGSLMHLLNISDIVVDCTGKNIAARNVPEYRRMGKMFIIHDGEKQASKVHSFIAENNYKKIFGSELKSDVSINSTFILSTLSALSIAGLQKMQKTLY